ncbi:MAG: hypothetical protein JSV89_13620 [Spirochaetaceae bacterium]|nr:MAG: hypothetical protein JSV89_13620 [Spirochaetaceae bacterium]
MKYGAITLVFLLIAVSLSGTPPDQKVNRTCLLLLATETEEANEIRSIVIEQLTREMEKWGFAIIPEQTWRAKLSEEELSSLELLQSSAVVPLAKRIEADIALVGSIQIESQVITLRIRGYDVIASNLVFSREVREAINIGIYNSVSSLSRELIDTLLGWAESQPGKIALSQSETSVHESELDEQRSRELQSPPTERVLESDAPPSETPIQDEGELAEDKLRVEPVVLAQTADRKDAKVRITLLSNDEGARVYLGPDQRLGTIENGKLVIEVPANTQLKIETTKPGYHTNREYFEVNNQSAEIRLRPLFKRTRFGFELFSTSSQLLGIGAGFRLYVVPDYIMFKADDYIYFSIGSGGEDSTSAFHNDFRIQFGSYLFAPPSRRVRFGVATGIGIILSALEKSNAQSENSTFYDFYWDVVDLWIDFNWQKGAVFFKVETKYALGLGVCLLEPGFLTKYGPQFTVGWLMKF